MKGSMRDSLLRKMKLIPTKSNLKQGLVVQLNPPDVFCIQKYQTLPIYDYHKGNNLGELDGSEGDKHFEEEEMDLEVEVSLSSKDKATSIRGSRKTKMELNSTPKVAGNINECPSLTDFQDLCPPGGSNSIILYTTSLRGIRKTFHDCNTIRFLLRSFKIRYQERDVSLHLEYREELWKILGGKVIPPKLFIKGRYIGGADEVVGLNETGWLGKLLEGTPSIDSTDCSCIGCASMGFAICSNCSGSCKVFTSNERFIRCAECNENGLVKCPICS